LGLNTRTIILHWYTCWFW